MRPRLPFVNRPVKRFSSISKNYTSQKNLLALKTVELYQKFTQPDHQLKDDVQKIKKNFNITFKIKSKDLYQLNQILTPKKRTFNHISPDTKIENIESQKSIQSLQKIITPNKNQSFILDSLPKNIDIKNKKIVTKLSPTIKRSENNNLKSNFLLSDNFKSQQTIEIQTKQKRVHKGKIKMKLLGKNPLQKRIKFDKMMIESKIISQSPENLDLSESFKIETKNIIDLIKFSQ